MLIGSSQSFYAMLLAAMMLLMQHQLLWAGGASDALWFGDSPGENWFFWRAQAAPPVDMSQHQCSEADRIASRLQDPAKDALAAAAEHDFRPMGYLSAPLGARRVEALGTSCPRQFRNFREVFGFNSDAISACMRHYLAIVEPYVTKYNEVLVQEASRHQIDLCVSR